MRMDFIRIGRRLAQCVIAIGLGSLGIIAQGEPLDSIPSDSILDNQQPRIIGGTTASNGAWPWAAAILHASVQDSYSAQFCGGSLITPYWVLTAAHCIESGVQANDLDVLLGTNQLSSGGERIRVQSIVVHPNYNPNNLDTDLALLLLSRPSSQTPVKLIDANDQNAITPGTNATVVGWGMTVFGNDNSFPDNLQQVTVPTVSNSTCEAGYDSNKGQGDYITSNMFCAGFSDGGKDSCQGDSGGPIMIPNKSNTGWIQAGIVSWGIDCAFPGQYGVYTRIANFRGFINAIVGAQLESPQQNSAESGIGLIRGWVCDANAITVTVDSFPVITAGYGTSRGDTASICGDSNNGFGVTINWNLFGAGTHIIRAFVDGTQFAEVPFTVTTLGKNFLTGVNQAYMLGDFPNNGQTTRIQWAQAHQNFVISNGATGGGGNAGNPSTGLLETPQVGSAESGVGLIRGWFCNAKVIEVQIDNFSKLQAAYGTPRDDTQAVCGDNNNGFGITLNWNLIGNGQHTIRAFADGVQFADVDFNVTTLGVNFLTGASGSYFLQGFPSVGHNTTISWSEAHQNFVITDFE